jgi:hypothetical protein
MKFKHNYKPGLALEIKSSPKERAKTNHKQIRWMTRWFVLPRFGSCKPTPHWGGHKDRVSFNPFPLSNGHLDRVSFSSQSNGTLSPHKDHHTIGVSCFDYKWVGNKNRGRRKAIQAQELKRTQKSLSLVTNLFGVISDLGEDLILEWSLELLYEVWWIKTWMHWSVVVGGNYSPNHQNGRWWGLLSYGASDSPVRQPRHPAVGFRPLELWHVGPPDSPVAHRTDTVHCSVRHLRLCVRSPRTVALSADRCTRPLRWRPLLRLAHRTVRCYTGQSGELYGAASSNSRRWQVWSWAPWCTGHCPVAHRTVRCARPGQPSVVFCSFYLNPFLDFLLVCVEPLAPIELII